MYSLNFPSSWVPNFWPRGTLLHPRLWLEPGFATDDLTTTLKHDERSKHLAKHNNILTSEQGRMSAHRES